jgi:hypothetical protein
VRSVGREILLLFSPVIRCERVDLTSASLAGDLFAPSRADAHNDPPSDQVQLIFSRFSTIIIPVQIRQGLNAPIIVWRATTCPGRTEGLN